MPSSRTPHATPFFALSLASLLSLLAPIPGHSEILIGTSLRNGGFEAETAAPWREIRIVRDPGFSHRGEGCGEAVAGTGRAAPFQTLLVGDPERRWFLLSFLARVEPGGFSSIRRRLEARKGPGEFFQPTEVADVEPVPSFTEWQRYIYLLYFEDAWDPSLEMFAGVGFDGGSAGMKGFVDDFLLVQLDERPPEEGSLALRAYGDHFVLVFDGILQASDDLRNPLAWQDLDPQPESPWLLPEGWERRFFRLREPE